MSTVLARDLPAELRPPLTREEALLEADRCLACGGEAPAPCVVACPAQVDVPTFVEALAEDDVDTAARTIFRENMLGATCARVCPVEVLCEGACVLLHEGQPAIEIARLQRYAADAGHEHGVAVATRAPATGRTVAIVGAGPAGLACAGELAARGHRVTVYEAQDEIGGLVRSAIAPYRIEREPLPAEARALEELGVRFRFGAHVSCLDRLAGFDAVFLGVGLGDDVRLELPGDDLQGVWESLDFVDALKSGRPIDVGRRVAVIGGGNTAIDVARESLRLGARRVTLVYRRTRREMPAYRCEVDEAAHEGVRFAWRALPVALHGSGRVSELECVCVRPGPPDGTGRRRPRPVPGTEFRLPVDTVVKAIGQRPRPELDGRFGALRVHDGLLETDDDGRTSNPRVFAGGDAVNGGASVVEAVRQGKRAARAIDRWLT
jgi:glutamate synthase (NADPH/NADH) small chain